jgi:hypothetical protein
VSSVKWTLGSQSGGAFDQRYSIIADFPVISGVASHGTRINSFTCLEAFEHRAEASV